MPTKEELARAARFKRSRHEIVSGHGASSLTVREEQIREELEHYRDRLKEALTSSAPHSERERLFTKFTAARARLAVIAIEKLGEDDLFTEDRARGIIRRYYRDSLKLLKAIHKLT